MDRQSNDQAKMDRTSNNDLQNITQKTKDRSTGTPLKPGMISDAMEWYISHYFLLFYPVR